jgi:hypothetical protein
MVKHPAPRGTYPNRRDGNSITQLYVQKPLRGMSENCSNIGI